MRVALNLSNFFTDHRSLAALLINSNMKLIKDVEQRISEIFHIRNFYLKYDNDLYLPPLESTELLSKDEIIWVVPVSGSPAALNQEDSGEQFLPKKPKKKKKRDVVETDEITNAEQETKKLKKHKKRRAGTLDLSEDEEPPKKQKSRERKQHKNKRRVDTPESNEERSVEKKKHKKRIREENERADPLANKLLNVSIQKDSGIETSSEEKQSQDCNSPKVQSVTKLVNYFESGRIKEVEKKSINIVRTLIVSNAMKTDIDFETPKSIVSEQASDSSDTETVEMPTVETKPPRRRRKRTRKRRSTQSLLQEETPSVENHQAFIPRPLLMPKPAQHIKFDAGLEEENTREVNGVEETTENKVEDEAVYNGNASDSTTDSHNPGITEEFIEKQPLTPNLKPRLHDLIAFKILKISESYTPEPSSYIVGKVLSIDDPCKEVVFHIIFGLDQCREPKGKFSLTQDEEEEEEETIPVEQKFDWSALFETRLLFP